jgi:outer membrane biosynthesis protein TonB
MFASESMTTSEFIIGHSADDALERKQEFRKVFWALLAALLVPLIVGYSIAVSGGLFSSHSVMEEDKPIELTFVDLNKPAEPKKNTMFMETPDSKKTVEPPPEKTFESNANSRAASEQPATGDAPLPSQQGKDRPSVDLDTHNYSLANQGAQPLPSVVPQESVAPSATPTPTAQPTLTPGQLAMLRPTPTPSPETRPSAVPQQQASSYQAYKEQTKIAGQITNRGISSVNALGTPFGRYQKSINDAIGSRWYYYIEQKGDLVAIGTLRLRFTIDRSGHVKNMKIIDNSSNESFANVCLQSVLEAKFPPIPEEIIESLPPQGLEVDGMSFTMFPN